MKFEFTKQYYQTILLIIEDKPKYEIPVVFYKILVLISYLQIFIYLLSVNESKQITDLKLEAIATIIQMISLKNILQVRNSDNSSLIIYIIIYIFMYSYFIYVGVLAIVKHYFESFYESQKKIFISINQVLNMYFALFVQIFFNQYIELNSSIMFCSKRSLFTTQRISDTLLASTCTIPSWQTILGGIGLFLTLVTAWIAMYFFRNYEFMEYNLIKRKTSNLFSILILIKFALTILYFSDLSGEEYIKHILSQVIGIISLVDYFVNHPYSDIRVAHFYLKVISWYYALVNLTHVWLFTNSLQSYEFFYFALIFGLIVESGFQSINNYRYDNFLLTETKFNYIPVKLDFYLEEIVRLATESVKDELSKVKLQKLIKSHMYSCQNIDCSCKEMDQFQSNQIAGQTKGKTQVGKDDQAANNNKITGIGSKGRKGLKGKEDESEEKREGDIDFDQVLQIVDSIFKFFLSQPIINKDQSEYEHLSLKYITFMIKYLKNYTRSNYELKLLQFQREDFSAYFKMISRIISDKIYIVISQMNIHLELRRKDELTVRQIMGVDEITQKYIPIIIKIMGEKQKLWGQLQKGYANMNHFQNEAIKLMRLVRNTRNQFYQDMFLLQRQLKVSQSLQYQKLFLIFNIFILNDNIRAYELELLVQDLRKRDSLKEIDILSNENYLRENIITLTISISQSIGKIVSRKDDKTAHYFGYNKQDFQKIQKINELMPPYFSKVHDSILKSFVNSGDSQYIKSSRYVFTRDQTGFIMQNKLYLDFTFISENDFQVNGTLLKVNQAFDNIIFHRTGKLIGISQRISQFLLCNSVQKGNKLPSGEFISNNLHIHLLLPKVAKRIFKKKDQIMQNLRSDGDILLQDRKGQIIVSSNPLMSIKRLQSYIIKMNQSKTTQNKVGSAAAFDQLDLFNEKSYEIINNYRKQEIDNSSAAGLSSGRLSAGKSIKSATTKGSITGKDHQKYRIRFNYTLSFHCTSHRLNNESDIYFQLKMSDVSLVKVKEKQRSYFRINLCMYLFSTCLVNKIDTKYKNHFGLNDGSKLSLQNDWIFTDQDIPPKLLKLITQSDNQAHNLANQNIEQKKNQKNKDNHHDNDNDIDQKSIHSNSSDDDEDDNNDYTDDEDENEEISIDMFRHKKKVLDQYEGQAKFVELNQVLGEHQIKETEILKFDPNFKAKKVMQFKSLTSAFGRALEKAVIEAMLELQEEKNLLLSSCIEDTNNFQDIATFRDFNPINKSNNQNHDSPILKQKNKEPNTTAKVVQIASQTQRSQIPQQNQQKQDLNMTSNTVNDISILPSFNNPYVNHDHNIDISSDNLHSYKNNNDDKSKYFEASARPLFKQHDELNVVDNEILITPSVEDNHRYLQETNITTFQNAMDKKNRNSLQQMQNSDMNISVGNKYMNNSILEQSKQEVPQKNANNSLVASGLQSHNQQQLSSEEKKQLEAAQVQGIKSDQTRDNDEGFDDQSGKLHEKLVVQLLNQKGLVGNDSINKGSIHSSSKSSGSYGGNFLKGIFRFQKKLNNKKFCLILEIISMCKIPKHSYQFLFLLIFFIVVFLCLNFTNLMIIKNDMQFFTNNVVVLRQPRKFLRSYAKTILGKIISYEIDIGILTDTDGSISKIANFYIGDGLKEYMSLVAQFQTVIIEYSQLFQNTLDSQTREVYVYEYQQQYQQEIDFALTFSNNINFLIGTQNNQNERLQVDSYLYLRANFFQFSTDILNFGGFLVQSVLDTVDNLILKFTIIAIAAIMGVIIVSLISIPIIRLINLYEEKILMIVSRINYDQSQVEKLKLNICQQLIDIDQYDWLKYNYNDIICLRFDQFDPSVVNSQHDLTKVSSRKGVEKINASNLLKMQQDQNNSKSKSANQVNTTQQGKFKRDLVKKIKNKAFDDGKSSYQEYQTSIKNSINKNYVLQSKILNQRLSIFQRFIPLFLLTICNTIYFLVIIIYLQQSKDLLKTPVQFNKSTIQYHIAQTTLKISAELLTFNFLIEEEKLKKIKSNDLDAYQQKMDDMIVQAVLNSSQNTKLVYGSNPFPASILNKFKDFEEGRICQYLVKYSCIQSETSNKYSINYLLQEKLRVINAYPSVITAADAPMDQLIAYSNSQDHINVFLKSFLIEDEVQDLYSSSANLSIGTISAQVQTFLEQYLEIFGNLFGLSIIVVCAFNWKTLYQRMQLMNLLLTFIPEEKLLEEVTLQMLKSLRRM